MPPYRPRQCQRDAGQCAVLGFRSTDGGGVSIWGKVVGGVAGFAIGGPLGAILGAIAGHALDGARGRAAHDLESERLAFAAAAIVLGAKMAKADGAVVRDEINAFKRVFRIPPEEVGAVSRLFNVAKREPGGYEPYARQMARIFADRPAVLEELLDALLHIAKADGAVHPAELAYLGAVARIFGFSDADFQRIRAEGERPEEVDPYAVLGLVQSSSEVEIKRAYRKLTRENHPDRLIAQGVPTELVELANEKMAAINAAYDRIARDRGLK